MYNFKRFVPYNTDYSASKRWFSHKVLYTEIFQSKNHSHNSLKNCNDEERSYITTYSGNNVGDFKYNALIFFIIQKLTNTEENPTFVLGKGKDKNEKKMSENYFEFLKEMNDVNSLQISFPVGKEKTKYTMSIDNFLNIITVSTENLHSEKITTANLLKHLSVNINKGIMYLDLIEKKS